MSPHAIAAMVMGWTPGAITCCRALNARVSKASNLGNHMTDHEKIAQITREIRASFKAKPHPIQQLWFLAAGPRGWRKGAPIYSGTPIDIAKNQAKKMAEFACYDKVRIVNLSNPKTGWEWSKATGWVEVT